MFNTYRVEKKNRKRSMTIAIVLHGLLVLLAFTYYFKVEVKDPDPDKPYKVKIELDFTESSFSTYARADVGEARLKSDVAEEIAPPKTEELVIPEKKIEIVTPTPVFTPATTPSPKVEVVQEESPIVIKQNPIQVDKPTADRLPEPPRPEPAKPSPPTPPRPSPPVAESAPKSTPANNGPTGNGNPNSTGTATEAGSRTNGDGAGKSNEGTGKGSDSGNDDTSGKGDKGAGKGEYDGSGNGIFGRKVVYRNYSGIPMTQSGTIIIKICVNRGGTVTYVELIELGTTIKDRDILTKSLRAAKGYRFQPDQSSPAEECGKLEISLDINLFKPR
jgi:outer membrane biosynthesis protein TonB